MQSRVSGTQFHASVELFLIPQISNMFTITNKQCVFSKFQHLMVTGKKSSQSRNEVFAHALNHNEQTDGSTSRMPSHCYCQRCAWALGKTKIL